MKKLHIITICASLIMLAACSREDSDNPQTSKALLLGKWQMISLVDDAYDLSNVLLYHYEDPAKPGDSVIFKNNNEMDSYIDVEPGEEKDIYPYEWVNDSTIKVDGDRFIIRKLTNSELTLYYEKIQDSKRKVELAYFTR